MERLNSEIKEIKEIEERISTETEMKLQQIREELLYDFHIQNQKKEEIDNMLSEAIGNLDYEINDFENERF